MVAVNPALCCDRMLLPKRSKPQTAQNRTIWTANEGFPCTEGQWDGPADFGFGAFFVSFRTARSTRAGHYEYAPHAQQAQRCGRSRRLAIPPSTKSHIPVVELAVGLAR